MLRTILGAVVGVIAGMITVSAVQALGHAIFPVPGTFDLQDRAQMGALVATMPLGALGMVVLAWILGAYVGSFVGLIAGGRARAAGVVPAAVMFLATLANLFMIPHPVWMAVVGLLGIVAAAWLADRLFARKR